ncbi:hypothetical protein C8F01DRAFT_1365332 [Mycena amicta]|nr:hypothetical protein C8F01DRAFT_1365332 [Mycena amicta]
MEVDMPETHGAVANPVGMFQNAASFGIHGGQFISAQGGVHFHPPSTSATRAPQPAHDEIYSENEVYWSQLCRRQRGFPLYVPEPQRNLPPEYLVHGVSIGDVGMVTAEGIWDFFFNIFLPSDHPINNGRVPEGFSPLEQYDTSDLHNLDFEAGSFLSSPSAESYNANFQNFPGGEYLFRCSAPKGAILCLPYGSSLQKITRRRDHVRNYAVQNAKDWYKYINGELGRDMVNGELYLITGREQAIAGGIATFQNVADGSGFDLAFKTVPDQNMNLRYRFNRGTAAQTKSFPQAAQDIPQVLNNTIFLHGFTISLGLGIWSALFGSVGIYSIEDTTPRRAPDGAVPFGSQGSGLSYFFGFINGGNAGSTGKQHVGPHGEEVTISDLVTPPRIVHPSRAINAHILSTVSDVAIVITHDDDWRDLPTTDILNPDRLGEQILERCELHVEDGIAYLSGFHDQDPESQPDDKVRATVSEVTARRCRRCKNLNVKCERKNDTDKCKRCLHGGHKCEIPNHIPSPSPGSNLKDLTRIFREQAAEIQRLRALLETTDGQLNQSTTETTAAPEPVVFRPPSPTSTVIGSDAGSRKMVFLGSSESKSKWGSLEIEEEADDAEDEMEHEIARPKMQPDYEPSTLPHILRKGLITLEEAEMLFKIYFRYMNLSTSLLDPVLCTARNTYLRNPFLFTVVCAVASRFYTDRPEVYPHAMYYAEIAAGTALIGGQKSVELVQAYVLLSLYATTNKKWEEERAWIYLGIAIRLAVELNLNQPYVEQPDDEAHARDLLNRTRVWLNCFNLDRSLGSQYGKRPTISDVDYIASRSADWWRSSPYNMHNFDIHISVYTSELQVMAGFLAKIYSDPNHPTGLNKAVDIECIASETDEQLKQVSDKWQALLREENRLERFAKQYTRLVVLSFGFRHAFGRNNIDENPFFMRCLSAASDVIKTMVEAFGQPDQRVYLRHGPSEQSVFVTFAASMLVKLLQPKFSSYLTIDKRQEIRRLVREVISILGSPDVSVDESHGPNLYARFLEGLLGGVQRSLHGPAAEDYFPAETTHSFLSASFLPYSAPPPMPPYWQPVSTLPDTATPSVLPFDESAPPLDEPANYFPWLNDHTWMTASESRPFTLNPASESPKTAHSLSPAPSLSYSSGSSPAYWHAVSPPNADTGVPPFVAEERNSEAGELRKFFNSLRQMTDNKVTLEEHNRGDNEITEHAHEPAPSLSYSSGSSPAYWHAVSPPNADTGVPPFVAEERNSEAGELQKFFNCRSFLR